LKPVSGVRIVVKLCAAPDLSLLLRFLTKLFILTVSSLFFYTVSATTSYLFNFVFFLVALIYMSSEGALNFL